LLLGSRGSSLDPPPGRSQGRAKRPAAVVGVFPDDGKSRVTAKLRGLLLDAPIGSVQKLEAHVQV